MHDYTDVSRYIGWIAAYDTLNHEQRAAAITAIGAIDSPQLFSLILIPTGGLATDRTLRSVVAQLYPFWEIWISEQDRPGWATDTRIKTVPSSVSYSDRLRYALERASGGFVSPITSDVSLAQCALYDIFCASVENPNGAIFYSDEDQLDQRNARCRPWLKTGWDPDRMLACNLIGQFAAYRREVLMRISMPEDADPQARLYALALSATWSVVPSRVIHVAKLLAHRSILPASAPYMAAVVQRFLRAIGSDAEVSPAPLAPQFNRVTWPLPNPLPRVTIILPTRDGAELLARSTSAVLERTNYANLELLVVDNDTVEPNALALLDRLRAKPNVRVLAHPGAFNYAAMNNRAAEVASGEVLVLLNSDTDVLNPDWLREMVSQACRLDVGVVGARLLYKDGRVQHAGIVFNDDMDIIHQFRLSTASDPGANAELAVVRSVLAVTGACLGIRKDVFFEVGQMDDVSFPIGFNDIDLCLRAGDHGYRVIVTPFAELTHLESATLGVGVSTGAKRDRYMAERSRFQARWASVVTLDPFHNRNLAHGWEKTDLAAPPRRDIPARMLAQSDSEAITPTTLRWSRTLQRLAFSRAFSNAELEKGRKILATVRGSEAEALRQRDAAELAREIAQKRVVDAETISAQNTEYLGQISVLSKKYDAVIQSTTWKIAKNIQIPIRYFRAFNL